VNRVARSPGVGPTTRVVARSSSSGSRPVSERDALQARQSDGAEVGLERSATLALEKTGAVGRAVAHNGVGERRLTEIQAEHARRTVARQPDLQGGPRARTVEFRLRRRDTSQKAPSTATNRPIPINSRLFMADGLSRVSRPTRRTRLRVPVVRPVLEIAEASGSIERFSTRGALPNSSASRRPDRARA